VKDGDDHREDEDYEMVIGPATADINEGLSEFFDPAPGFRLEEFAPVQLVSGGAWMAWTFEGQHNTKNFAGIEPTNLAITVRGATFVDRTKEPVEFRRYIDWIDVCQQLGLSLTGRPAVDPEGDV
jgi:hypothetical protein